MTKPKPIHYDTVLEAAGIFATVTPPWTVVSSFTNEETTLHYIGDNYNHALRAFNQAINDGFSNVLMAARG